MEKCCVRIHHRLRLEWNFVILDPNESIVFGTNKWATLPWRNNYKAVYMVRNHGSCMDKVLIESYPCTRNPGVDRGKGIDSIDSLYDTRKTAITKSQIYRKCKWFNYVAHGAHALPAARKMYENNNQTQTGK